MEKFTFALSHGDCAEDVGSMGRGSQACCKHTLVCLGLKLAFSKKIVACVGLLTSLGDQVTQLHLASILHLDQISDLCFLTDQNSTLRNTLETSYSSSKL